MAEYERRKRMIDDAFYPFPLTICLDRYFGTYSGGIFTAWNLNADLVPKDISGDDVTCAVFWENNELPVGKGNTPEQAINDLSSLMMKKGEKE
jgi:hypothetical protein